MTQEGLIHTYYMNAIFHLLEEVMSGFPTSTSPTIETATPFPLIVSPLDSHERWEGRKGPQIEIQCQSDTVTGIGEHMVGLGYSHSS